LQNRYPLNQWQEILGNCDVQLFLGCTDELTATFISDRTGEASVQVSSRAKQLGTWRVSDYTPEYRETSGVGRRKVLTMDEVLRLPIDKALVILRGQKVLQAEKFDYSEHPEAAKLRPAKASAYIPDRPPPRAAAPPPAIPKPRQSGKPAQKAATGSAKGVVRSDKNSIISQQLTLFTEEEAQHAQKED
jgi:type IV secretion system protein VirD4